MNFHKWLMGSAIAVSAFALVACGSDSSSSGNNGGNSGSGGGTVIPVTSDSSWVAISNFSATLSGEQIRFSGSAYVVDSLTTSGAAHLDSVKLILKDESGNQLDLMTLTLNGTAQLTIENNIFSGATAGNVTTCSSDASCSNVNFSFNLSAMIDVASSALTSCGTFKTYAVAYGSDSLKKVQVASDSTTFVRSSDYCAVSSSSVNSSSSATFIAMVPFTATLSTESLGNVGIDLDTRTLYAASALSASANAVDIILTYKSKTPAFENAESYGLSATASAQIAEETSGTEPSASTSALVFTYGALTSSTLLTNDGSDGLLSNSVWVVKTPSFDANTMKGFFVVAVGAVSNGSTTSVPVTIWYVQ